jgi:hypothetical protein
VLLDSATGLVLELELLPLLLAVFERLRYARRDSRGEVGGCEVVWVERLVRVVLERQLGQVLV